MVIKRRYIIIGLIMLVLAGAFFGVLGNDMLIDDIFNIANGFTHSTLPVTLPALSVASFFLLAILYLLRVYRHPKCAKRISKIYLIIMLSASAIGLVGVVLSGTLVYGTFVGDHPFTGYLIIFFWLNLLLLVGSIIGLVFLRKMKDDEERYKSSVGHVFSTMGWVIFTVILLNRTGLFLSAPLYVYTRNLYQTFPFYLYLLMPLFLGVLEVLYILDLIDYKKLQILAFVSIGVNVGLFTYIVLMGTNDTMFISSLSTALPLERMAALPLEIIIQVLSYLGVAIALLVQNSKRKEN